jgi:carbamoyl-phosphate synthase small subunit
LNAQQVVAIDKVDTRALVAHVRTKGAMNCIVSSEMMTWLLKKQLLEEVPSMDGLELASKVSTTSSYELGDEKSSLRIAVLDFGVKKNILHCLAESGAYVKVYNARTPFSELQQFNPTGYFISNGPGDPAPMDYAIETVKRYWHPANHCLEFAWATSYWHWPMIFLLLKCTMVTAGLNHPVKNIITGKSEITTQNHGFGIDPEAVRANDQIEITHINLNDDSIEGISIKNKKAFSVQYHPEATPGHRSNSRATRQPLFDDFISLITARQPIPL